MTHFYWLFLSDIMALKGLSYDVVMSEAQSNFNPRYRSTHTLMLDIEVYSIRWTMCLCFRIQNKDDADCVDALAAYAEVK